MLNSTTRPIGQLGAWPLTREAWDRLIDEIGRQRDDLSSMAGQGMEEGILRLPVAIAEKRLETLKAVLDRCQLVDDTARAAIGRRATLLDADGTASSYEIVFPGDGDPDMGRISADSPLGGALLGAKARDVLEVSAPGGRWSVTVVSVD
jgi:transcription elongation GreA/GreB family factor